MRVDQWRPVRDNFLEIWAELDKRNHSLFMQVHQSKRKLIPLIIIAINKQIHQPSKLCKSDEVIII